LTFASIYVKFQKAVRTKSTKQKNMSITNTVGEKLDALWAKLLPLKPTSAQLIEVVKGSPYLRDKAWQAFIETKPGYNEVCDLYHNSTWNYFGLRQYPAKLLLTFEEVNDSILVDIMVRMPYLAKDSAEILLQRKPSSLHLTKIILSPAVPIPMREQAAEVLINSPTTDEPGLVCIIECVPGQAERAARKLLEMNSPQFVMLTIFLKIPSLANEAWRQISVAPEPRVLGRIIESQIQPYNELAVNLAIGLKNPDFNSLLSVMKVFPNRRQEAWQILKAMDLDNESLRKIARECPAVKEEAEAKMKASCVDEVAKVMNEIFSLSTTQRASEF